MNVASAFVRQMRRMRNRRYDALVAYLKSSQALFEVKFYDKKNSKKARLSA